MDPAFYPPARRGLFLAMVDRMRDSIDVLGTCDEREELVGLLIQDVVARSDLTRYVQRAAGETRFPISLVSLMGKRSQLLVASTGLPPELASIGATDRSVSLCQLVVRDEALTEIEDASLHADAPQGLVKAYGVRGYFGVPLRVQNRVVGSLCVVDTQPRQFSNEQRSTLERLGEDLSAALDSKVAALLRVRQGEAHGEAVEPIFNELRNLLGPLTSGVGQAALTNAEIQAAFRLLQVKDVAARERAQSVLGETLQAGADMGEIMGELQETSERLSRSILAMESLFDRVDRLKPIGQCVSQASVIAHHLTKLVGGVRLECTAAESVEAVARDVVPVLAMLLGLGSRRLLDRGLSGGLSVDTQNGPNGYVIQIRAPQWSHEDAASCVRGVAPLLGDEPQLSCTAVSGALIVRSGAGSLLT